MPPMLATDPPADFAASWAWPAISLNLSMNPIGSSLRRLASSASLLPAGHG